MRPSHFALITPLLLCFATLASSNENIVDLATVKDPADLYRVVKPKSLNKESSVFVRLTTVVFTTQSFYQVGDNDVYVSSFVDLVGVDNATFQAITDEYEAYAQQKLGEIFTVIPFAQVEATKAFAKTKYKNPPEEFGVEKSTGLKAMGMKTKTFSAGNRALTDGWDVGNLYAAMELKSGTMNWSASVQFSIYSDDTKVKGGWNSKTAYLQVEPYIWVAGVGASYSSQKMQVGGIDVNKPVGMPGDRSWVKEVRKPAEGKMEVVADPVLFKEAVLKVLKINVDNQVAILKEARS